MTVKAAITLADMRSQCAIIAAAAMNGAIEEGRGRLAIRAFGAAAELFKAETHSRLVAAQLNETITPLGQQVLGSATT